MSSYFFGGFSANLIVPSGRKRNHCGARAPMGGRARLDREIERHLHAELRRRVDEAAEIVQCAELGMHGAWPPSAAPIA